MDELGREQSSVLILGVAVGHGVGEGEEEDFFAGEGADVVMQAQHLHTGDLFDQFFHGRARGFDEMGAYLLEEIAAFFRGHGPDEVLFGGGEHPLQSHNEKISQQMRLDIFRPPAHVFLLKTIDSCAHGGFDFAL